MHYIIFIEPYVPYTVTVGAATVIGLGEVFPVTFFTNQEGESLDELILLIWELHWVYSCTY